MVTVAAMTIWVFTKRWVAKTDAHVVIDRSGNCNRDTDTKSGVPVRR